ncbi:hypothetical protein BDQ17DRAFT_1411126 [Cyathus striatus]|nr:hypothetical protein BDQ17DRAFT_1411126 [Cyathus striatus]
MHRRTGAVVILLSLLSCTLADSIVNRTIDDSLGDSDPHTFTKPLYNPPSGVWDDETCQKCAIKPDPSKAFKNTYTAATYNPGLQNVSISMGFEGTAIYVYFILANNQGDGITTLTVANFTIDGQMVGTFRHDPDLTSTDILFNQLVFNKTDIPNGVHQLIISTSDVDFSVFINFDYAIYTHVDSVDPAPSSTSSTSTQSFSSSPTTTSSIPSNTNPNAKKRSFYSIVGGVVGAGAVVLIGAIIGSYFCWKRRARRRQFQPTHRGVAELNDQDMPNASDTATMMTPLLPLGNSGADLSGSNQLLSPASKAPTSLSFIPGDTKSNSYDPSSLSSQSVTAIGRDEIRQARQRELQRRLLVIHQEMNELRAELSTHEVPGASAEIFEIAQAGGDSDEIVRGMSEQMQAMQAQIEFLQSQQQSEWAQGLTNDPPPGYTP